ncbi:type II secretion system F family protein [Nonomuraea wenchangensis]|uniref:type II secretion system F family protein n=1 Tax=Nonomuraea wenchangensis TaxID=568860 RepID=UPI0033265A7B
MLSALCAAMAVWLWLPAHTPKERLTRLKPPTSPGDQRSLDLSPGLHHRRRANSKSQAPTAARDSVTTTHPADTDPPPPTWLDQLSKHPRPRVTGKTILIATSAGLAIAVLIGGAIGVAVGLLITPAAGIYLHKRQSTRSQQDQQQILTDLPFAADLMTACLLAGCPVSSATEIAADAIGGPLGRSLGWVSTQLRLGADAEPTWALLAKDPALGQLSRTMIRATQSGTPVADALTRLADDARDASRAAAAAAARRVGVKAVAPLGLCFLPAFVLLGIVPVVADLASALVLP